MKFEGDGDHYSATVISKSFAGKSKIEQHKMVYDSLNGKMEMNFIRNAKNKNGVNMEENNIIDVTENIKNKLIKRCSFIYEGNTSFQCFSATVQVLSYWSKI